MGASYAYSYTTLKFDDNGSTLDVDLKKLAFDVFLERRFGERFTAQIGLGAALAGHAETLGTTHEVLPGPALSVAGSYRLVDGRGAAPFVMASASLAASGFPTRELGSSDSETMYAFDGRLGLTVGKTFASIVSPYVAARAFGLPVLWNVQGQDVTGTDKYHYQVGAGVAVRLGPADIVAEWMPLGEGEVLFAAGMAF